MFSDRFKADTYSKNAGFFHAKKRRRYQNVQERFCWSRRFIKCHLYKWDPLSERIFCFLSGAGDCSELTSEKKGKLFSCLLERGRFLEWSGKTGENTVMIRGSQGEGGVRYCGAISVTAAAEMYGWQESIFW